MPPRHQSAVMHTDGDRDVQPSPRYLELKLLIREGRLLDKQQSFYMMRMFLNFCLLGVAILVLICVRNFGWQLVNAAFLGFVFTQMGFIVHDSGHRQILNSGRGNDFVGIFHADLCLGFSYMRWVKTHNQHHRNPNQIGADPDTDFPVLAFTESQAIQKRGIWRWVAKYQSYFFFPCLLFEAVHLKVDCIRFLVQNKVKYRRTESGCMVIHFLLYFGFIVHSLHWVQALLFIAVHQMVFGLYLGMVIAPNHIGMPILERNSRLDFFSRQLITTRNLRHHPLTDYLFGPLCCQIEHHLFPTLPLNKLRSAQKIVRSYCEEHGLGYYETNPLQSYREIISFLHRVSAPLRSQFGRNTNGNS